jgi:hypothetical protein
MYKKNELKIEFISDIPGLTEIEDIVPKTSKNYVPNWWKDISPRDELGNITIKMCPSFPDFFSTGYVLPMWQDIKLRYEKEIDQYFWEESMPNTFLPVRIHQNSQFMNHVDNSSFLGSKYDFVFKLESPWKIITPPGYSVLQLPLFYNFDNDFSALPGIIDSDITNMLNVQITYHKQGEDLIIERGTPLAMYFPFKREKYDLSVREKTKEDEKVFFKNNAELLTKFVGSGQYRKLQAKRNRKD